MPITDQYREKIHNYSRMQYSPIRLDWKWNNRGGEFFNMGMMLMNKRMAKYLKGQTPHQFINRTEFKQFVDGLGPWKWSTDQTLLNTWIKQEQMSVKHLDWKWNGLFKGIQDDKVKEAYFVHFFLKDKLPNRGEDVKALMKEVL